MKIVDGFVLKKIADTNVVVPLGTNTVSFRSMVSLNDTGAFLWKLLEKETTEEDLLSALLEEYNVDRQTAETDIKAFLNSMRDANLLV